MRRRQVLYDDGTVSLDRDGVTIKKYYFPLATSKRIPYRRIRDVRAWHMGPLSGKGRIWGSGDFQHWAPLDMHRPRKDTALVFDVGRWIKPVVTPDDPDRVLAILRKHTARSLFADLLVAVERLVLAILRERTARS